MNEGLLALHNQYRSEYKPWGLWRKPKPIGLLSMRNDLMLYAVEHCMWMSNNGALKHSNISKIMKLGYKTCGENIAFGQRTTEEVMKTWMNSYGHRKNILNPSFKYMGYGFDVNSDGLLYWCVVFGG